MYQILLNFQLFIFIAQEAVPKRGKHIYWSWQTEEKLFKLIITPYIFI